MNTTERDRYSDQKVQDAGHKSQKMHDTYSRKLRVVEPAE